MLKINNIPSTKQRAFTHPSGLSQCRKFGTDERRAEYLYHPWIKSKPVWISATKKDGRTLYLYCPGTPGSVDLDPRWLSGERMSQRLVR
jgi:hypothetical protein